MAIPWPFFGREAELARVARALGADGAGGVGGVLVAGLPGTGKSWLVAEARRALERQGRLVLVAETSEEAREVPFGALSPLLPVLVPERGALNLMRWAREVLLDEAAGRGQVPVLCVDDVQLMDPLSAALVRRMVRAGELRLLAAGAVPDGLRRLWEDRLLERVEVGPFTREETEALLGSLERRAARRLYERSRGHPLFLRELALSGEELPDRVVAHVTARVGGAREALELVALGEPVALSALGELVDVSLLEEAEARGLIVVAGPWVRLAHPLYAEVLRGSCPRTREGRHRRALVRALGGAGLLAGAREAWAGRDPGGTVRLASAAWQAGGGAGAALLLAAALIWTERYAEAEAVLGECEALPMERAERARHAVLRAYGLSWGLRRFDDAERVLGEAEGVLGAEAVGRRVAVRGAAEDYRGALELAGGGGSAGGAVGGRGAVGGGGGSAAGGGGAAGGAALLTGVAVACAYTGRPLEARAVLVRAGEVVGFDPTEVLPLRLAAYAAEFWAGDLAGAWRAADAYAEALGRRGDALYGAVLLWRGQVRAALARLRGSHPGAAAHAAALVGDAEMAERYLASGGDQWAELARPWVAVAGGRVSEAVELASSYAARAGAAGLVGFELLALHDVARLGGARKVAARVAELEHEGALAAVCAGHVAAAAERSGAGLWAVSLEFERLGYLLFAAEAAAGALRAGAPGAAARAHMLAARCEGARTPLLAGLAAPALTRRELEVAGLAAGGLTSRAIAARLGLSPRTVDNHLTSAYAKLGVTSRGDLAAVLGSPGV